MVNTKKKSQLIPQETELGEVHDVEEVRELDKVEEEPVGDYIARSRSVNENNRRVTAGSYERPATESMQLIGKIPRNYLYGKP